MSVGAAEISVIYDNYDVTPLVKSVEWSGHSEKPNRQLNVSLANTLNGRSQAVKINKGRFVEFRNNGTLLFRGVVFSTNISDRGDLDMTVYDENYYLLKSSDSRKFTNVKASEIIVRLCKDFGIPYGTITNTGYVIPKLIFREKTLHDMILYALTLTKKQTGKRYFLSNRSGKLYLTAPESNPSKWVIEAGSNLTAASYSTSIEETKSRVKVVGGKNDAIVVTLTNNSLAKSYGIMQEVELMEEKSTKSQVEQRARALLKERGVIDDQASVDAIGIDSVVTGTAVYVNEPMTGIVGGYYVTSDTHRFANGAHTMSLELSFTYDLPKIEIEKEVLGK